MIPKMTQYPRCKSADVYTRTSGVGWHPQLMVNGVGFAIKPTDDWITYLCTNCGYFENYVTKAGGLAKIKADPQEGRMGEGPIDSAGLDRRAWKSAT